MHGYRRTETTGASFSIHLVLHHKLLLACHGHTKFPFYLNYLNYFANLSNINSKFWLKSSNMRINQGQYDKALLKKEWNTWEFFGKAIWKSFVFLKLYYYAVYMPEANPTIRLYWKSWASLFVSVSRWDFEWVVNQCFTALNVIRNGRIEPFCLNILKRAFCLSNQKRFAWRISRAAKRHPIFPA